MIAQWVADRAASSVGAVGSLAAGHVRHAHRTMASPQPGRSASDSRAVSTLTTRLKQPVRQHNGTQVADASAGVPDAGR